MPSVPNPVMERELIVAPASDSLFLMSCSLLVNSSVQVVAVRHGSTWMFEELQEPEGELELLLAGAEAVTVVLLGGDEETAAPPESLARTAASKRVKGKSARCIVIDC